MPTTSRVTPEDIRRGAVIKERRTGAGMSAAQLGSLAGLTASFIYAIENGREPANDRTCRRIADAFGIALAAITVDGYDALRDDEQAITADRLSRQRQDKLARLRAARSELTAAWKRLDAANAEIDALDDQIAAARLEAAARLAAPSRSGAAA